MLKITKNTQNNAVVFALDGRLDTITASQLETEIRESIDGIVSLVLDFKKLEYVSSAGLRVILSAQKRMNEQGKMIITNVNKPVMDILEVTGFADILTIE